MSEIRKVTGYDEFREVVNQLYTGKELIYVYFSGQKDEDGISWCSDCVAAEKHVLEGLEKFGQKDGVFLMVDVGDRAYWKDLTNDFRKDTDVRLSVIPTLIKWGGVQRLELEQLLKSELLEMFFEDETD